MPDLTIEHPQLVHLDHKTSFESVALQEILTRTLSPNTDRASVNRLVQIASNLALALLRHQIQRGSLEAHRFGISVEDLAIDCVADIFTRDARGHFVTLEAYFISQDWTQLSEEDLSIALRRLVFSKVNEGLFRSYRSEDPNLAKIIRNIKEAIKRRASMTLFREREVQWIVAGSEDTPQFHLPMAPSDILESYLTPILCTTANTYTAVYAFEEFLRMHPYYRNAFPTSEYARILRSCFSNRHISEQKPVEINLAALDVENALQKTMAYIRTKLHSTYVRTGKVSASLFETYVRAVQKILAVHFGYSSESISSQYDALATLLPGLSRSTFQAEHRNIMQYFFKVSRNQMIGYLSDPV